MSDELRQQVNQHRYEIDSLKGTVAQQVRSSEQLNRTMNELCNQLGRYIERTEHTKQDVQRIESEISRMDTQHNERIENNAKELAALSNTIAGHSPVIESVSGIFNKILGTFFVGLIGASGLGWAVAKAFGS